jgi:hypothetical protein
MHCSKQHLYSITSSACATSIRHVKAHRLRGREIETVHVFDRAHDHTCAYFYWVPNFT